MDVLTTVALVAVDDKAPDDPTPDDNDVVAGFWGGLIFILLILAVVILSFSFVKQMRKVRAAREAGVYGDEPPRRGGHDSTVPDGPGRGPDADADGGFGDGGGSDGGGGGD